MALRRKRRTSQTESEDSSVVDAASDEDAPVEPEVAEEPAVETPPNFSSAPSGAVLVKAVQCNLRHPYTGVWYRNGKPEEAEVGDSWIESQLQAGLMSLVDSK